MHTSARRSLSKPTPPLAGDRPVSAEKAADLSAQHDRPANPDAAVPLTFILAYAVVQISVFAAYTPVLSILLPLKLQMLEGSRQGVSLSFILFAGALTASVTNIAVGALSDRTSGPLGRRRPWLVVGAAGLIVSFGLIYASPSDTVLTLGVVSMQMALNCVFAPLTALLADRVPDRQKGLVAGFLSLGPSLGMASGAGLIGGVLQTQSSRFIALALIVLCVIAPFAVTLADRPFRRHTAPQRPLEGVALWRLPNFVLLWIIRFLIQCAIATTIGYLFFYVEDTLGSPQKTESRVALFVGISMISGVLAGPISGVLSDRFAARRRFLFAGAAGVSGALALLALASTWTVALIAAGLLGAGVGCFSAIDGALAAQVIPSLRNAGRDLGILNLANALPQAATPLLALAIFAGVPGEKMRYALLFGVCAALSLIGGGLAMFIKLPPCSAEPIDAP
jgi:MFS family permease